MSITTFISYAIKHQINFVSFRKPGSKQIMSVVGNECRQLDLNEIRGKGFVLTPFQGQPVFLPADYTFTNHNYSFSWLKTFENRHFSRPTQLPRQLSKATYLKTCKNFIDQIKAGQFEKLILSRPIIARLDNPLEEVFQSLVHNYPNAFVYILNLDQYGTWIGATPELFLKTNGGTLETVALAGTQPVDMQRWTSKERKEQAYVTNFIYEVLRKFDSHPIDLDGPNSVAAGPVAHLSTKISAMLRAPVHEIIQDLHPTPAVCGIPKKKAKAHIQENEGYDRGFYSGFLGIVDQSNLDLFVNLRCMQIIDDTACIYVGSGITSDSDPEKEWEETVLKSHTLMEMIEAIKC